MRPCVGPALIALLLVAASARAQRPEQKRVLTFHDGSVPRIEARGERFVHGEFELVIQFADTNPLCFAYGVDGHSLGTPGRPPAPAFNDIAASATGTQLFRSVEQAHSTVQARLQDLGTLSLEAAREASLDQVWNACLWADPPSRVLPLQRKRIAEVDTMLRTRLGENGAWTRILVGTLDTIASVRKEVHALPSEDPDNRTPAQRRLLTATSELERYLTATLSLVSRLQEDLERAQIRLASSPASTTRHIADNRRVVVEVTRTRLDRGQPGSALDTITVTNDAYESLPPILFDLGIGPSLTLHNTEDYGLGQSGNDRPPNVKRTEDSANVDIVVSMSMYIWGYRYLDDRIFDPKQLLPRPMVGLSMDQPFSSLYLGLQVDPIQFVDISFGARAYSTNHLLSPEEGELAFDDANGEPSQPVIRRGVTTQMFVSLTASTDLVQRWIQRSF